jgi:hypothetical protein
MSLVYLIIFSVSINGFNDGQQDFRFFVSAAIQMDCLARRNEDFSGCDMGKQSHYHRFWMVVEMKILMPLCAFPMPKQTWD